MITYRRSSLFFSLLLSAGRILEMRNIARLYKGGRIQWKDSDSLDIPCPQIGGMSNVKIAGDRARKKK